MVPFLARNAQERRQAHGGKNQGRWFRYAKEHLVELGQSLWPDDEATRAKWFAAE